MQTEVMKMFGLKAPIFAFSHCRDVVAAVSRAGGLGALGTTRESVSELEVMLNWIDDHIDDEPYGVDVVFPSKAPKEFETMSAKEVIGLIPQTHWDFVEDVLREYGVPPHTKEEKEEAIETFIKEQFRTHAQAEARLDVVYQHPKARLIVSALGVPPQRQIDRAHELGLKVAALVGHPKHVKYHKAAGIDILISAGYEAGGHTGDIATFVLTPQIADAAAPTPVLHAGGVMRGRQIAAALALGAQGVWTGTIWLGTAEAETTLLEKELMYAATSGDTKRTRCGSGKPVRRYLGGFVRAWESEGAPKPLPTPLQAVLMEQAFKRMKRYEVADLYSPPCGQGVGMMEAQTDVRSVFRDLLTEYGETLETMTAAFDEMTGT